MVTLAESGVAMPWAGRTPLGKARDTVLQYAAAKGIILFKKKGHDSV